MSGPSQYYSSQRQVLLRRKHHKRLLEKLVRSRFRSKRDVGLLMDEIQLQQQRQHARPLLAHGVHKGVYYRIPVPSLRPLVLPNLPKLPATPLTSPPKSFIPSSSSSSSSGSAGSVSECSEAATTSSASSSVSQPVQTANCRNAAADSLTSSSRLTRTDEWVYSDFWQRLKEWWNNNWSIMVLNIGSICTLTAFTRSDVLELRSLSVLGSCCSVVYMTTLRPFRWVPVAWSLLFASVNSYKISRILQERTSSVRLTQEQERIYVEHFLMHGVTPKQFEILYEAATIKHYRKGTVLWRQGDKMNRVSLVVQGATRATTLGRRVSAASVPLVIDEGGEGKATLTSTSNASAWIGEMAFLERCWIGEQLQLRTSKGRSGGSDNRTPELVIKPAITSEAVGLSKQPTKPPGGATKPEVPVTKPPEDATKTESPGTPSPKDPTSSVVETAASEAFAAAAADSPEAKLNRPSNLMSKRTFRRLDAPIPHPKMDHSLYTIVALDDCVVLEWTHSDMLALLERSSDMRAALTRAMSAAVVGKVINFTVSKSHAKRSWAQWLEDWAHDVDGISAPVQEETEEGGEVDEAAMAEVLPTHPIKKFT